VKASGSKMGLLAHCLYWARDDVPWPDDPPSDAAKLGSWYHAVVCWMIQVLTGTAIEGAQKPEPPSRIGDANEWTPEDDARALCLEYPNAEIRAEAAYVYSPRGVRFLGYDIGRDYGELAPDEIPCSLDVVILDGARAVVVDWKTGRRENTEPAATNAQLLFGALCVHLYHGALNVEVQLRFADGWIDRHTYDAFDLMDYQEEIDALIFDASGASTNGYPEPRPGIHCTSKWCPARSTCPKTVESVPDGDALVLAPDAVITSPEHAGSLYHRMLAARTLLDRVDAAIKAYVDEHGAIPLGDGKEFALVDRSEWSIAADSPEQIFDALDGSLTKEEFAPLIRVSVPKGELEKAIKAKSQPRKGASDWRDTKAKFEAAGIVATKVTQRHRVRKAQ